MTGNDSKSFLGYLNELVDKYNNTSHCSISKKAILLTISPCLKKLNWVIKLPSLKLVKKSGLLNRRAFLAKAT